MPNILQKREPIVIRASAALPAAGAFTAQLPVLKAVDVRLVTVVSLVVSYAAGGAGGAFQVTAHYWNENVYTNASAFKPVCVQDATIAIVAGTGYAQNSAPWIGRSDATIAGDVTFVIPVHTYKYIRFAFAEYGNVGAQGTLSSTLSAYEGA